MLGWHVSVYRQTDGGHSPATHESEKGTRLAVWQTGLGGLDWLNELAATGKAIDLGGNGYPNRYTALPEYLMPGMVDEPPRARDAWLHDASDLLLSNWAGKTVIDQAAQSQCRADEWLLVEAWDES